MKNLLAIVTFWLALSSGALAQSAPNTGGAMLPNASVPSLPLSVANGGTGGVNGALSALTFGSSTALAAAATVFYGQGVSGASDGQFVVVPVSGTVSNLSAFTSASPGGATTYTFTLDLNASSQTMTCQTTGSAQTCTDNAHPIAVIQGSLLSIKAVASAGTSTSTGNYFSVSFKPN